MNSEFEEKIENEEDEDELDNEEKEAIIKTFERLDYEYTVLDVLDGLNENGFVDAGDLILAALENNILYVSSIDKDGTVYLALSSKGEEMWKKFNSG